MEKTITQTAGRDQPGEFAPMFAHLNDDVLFGEMWKSSASRPVAGSYPCLSRTCVTL